MLLVSGTTTNRAVLNRNGWNIADYRPHDCELVAKKKQVGEIRQLLRKFRRRCDRLNCTENAIVIVPGEEL